MSVAIISSVIPSNSPAPLWQDRFPASIRPDLVLQADGFDGDGAVGGRQLPWRKEGQAPQAWTSSSALLKTEDSAAYYDSASATDQVFGYFDHKANGEVMATIEWGGGDRVTGVTFRMGTISNYWDFVLRSTGVALRKTVSASTANQATAAFTPAVGVRYRLHVAFDGDDIVATVAGEGMDPVTLSVTSSDMQGNIRAGMTVGILHRVHDFSVG